MYRGLYCPTCGRVKADAPLSVQIASGGLSMVSPYITNWEEYELLLKEIDPEWQHDLLVGDDSR